VKTSNRVFPEIHRATQDVKKVNWLTDGTELLDTIQSNKKSDLTSIS